MSIKVRLTLVFMGLSLLLLVGTLGYIRTSQEVSRREEFFERLRDHANRMAGLLGDIEAADRSLLQVMDLHSIQRLYDEKVLIFNAADQLLYSSLDNEPIPYSLEQLRSIREGEELAYRDSDGDEVVGIHYAQGGQDLVILASANDRYGRQELENLTRTLWVSLVLGSLFIFGAGYFYIGLVFRPVERLNQAIAAIDVNKLDERLPVRDRPDEIDRLAVNYNHMLDRLREAFDLQRAFVNSASHELRTPLARMNAQVERALALPIGSPDLIGVLYVLQNDIAAQASLVESLLLLQRLQAHIPAQRTTLRIDEVLYASVDEVRIIHPRMQADVDLSEGIVEDKQLTVHMNELLLRTCFRNLILNAVTYAPDLKLHIVLEPLEAVLRITITNAGDEPLPAERVFEPFFRGAQPGRIKGNGLGLSIVRQIVLEAGGSIRYLHDGAHRFTVELPTT